MPQDHTTTTEPAHPQTALDGVLDCRFARALPALSVAWRAHPAPAPAWLCFNEALAHELGLDAARWAGPEGLAVLAGHVVPEGAQPVAQVYAGHQFGGYAPRLGDGRALLLGEITTPDGRCVDVALKGSGRTPLSRGGDGKAAIGPMLREYLISEAMHALGIPTTRSLAVLSTGEQILRDRPEPGMAPGAVLCRIAASHVRVGSFQYLAAAGDTQALGDLVDFSLARHYAGAVAIEGDAAPALALLRAVVDRQAALVARWMGVGFIHGVMNTDNMTLSGETIDYGPCAFMEQYAPDTVFSSIDHQGRYAYGNQPLIAQWNLARLAETLLPLLDDSPERALALANEVIQGFGAVYQRHWTRVLCGKLGLVDEDVALGQEFLQLLQEARVDFTQAFRALSAVLRGQPDALDSLWGDAAMRGCDWQQRWLEKLGQRVNQQFSLMDIADAMDAVNPAVIPRNQQVERVLLAAQQGDMEPFWQMHRVLQQPYATPADARWLQAATSQEALGYRTFCGT